MNPPQDNQQGTVTSSAQTLSAILSASPAIVNRGGFQLAGILANTVEIYWGLTNGVTTGTGSPIPPGGAQLVSPIQAPDSDSIYLIAASSSVVAASFPGG